MLYGPEINATHNALCFLDTGAIVSLTKASLLQLSCNGHGKRYEMSEQETGSRQAIKSDRLVHLALSIDDLRKHVWFDIARHLAVTVHIGTSFIDHIVDKIVLTGRRDTPWHSPPAAILRHNHQMEITRHLQYFYYAYLVDENASDIESPHCVHIARQVVPKSNGQHEVQVTTKISGVFTTKSRHLQSNEQHTIAEYSIMDAPSNQPGLVLDSKLTKKKVYLPSHVNIVNTMSLPDVILAIKKVNLKTPSIERPEG